jgi:hypothetical protein
MIHRLQNSHAPAEAEMRLGFHSSTSIDTSLFISPLNPVLVLIASSSTDDDHDHADYDDDDVGLGVAIMHDVANCLPTVVVSFVPSSASAK